MYVCMYIHTHMFVLLPIYIHWRPWVLIISLIHPIFSLPILKLYFLMKRKLIPIFLNIFTFCIPPTPAVCNQSSATNTSPWKHPSHSARVLRPLCRPQAQLQPPTQVLTLLGPLIVLGLNYSERKEGKTANKCIYLTFWTSEIQL